ncbi:MAG: nitronate monooxygenase [Promethearchaeota archaeon]|nr:MAG: nitronate monooxygenase [Candidatus Lokiarchaeota archaeon]
MKWNTRITELINIKYPIIMGAFASVGRAEFAASFSKAGGLGIITALNFGTNEEFEKEIKKMKKLTSKPFGVNFSIMPPMMASKVPHPRDEDFYMDYVHIALDEGVRIFTTSAYQAPKISEVILDAEAIWFHKCTTLKHALSTEKLGAHGVTIVGVEGTGFKNPLQNTTLVNMTMARKLLKIPLIAAGGIGDARGFLSALAMGADAVCFGTAILATYECKAPHSYKRKLIHQDIFDEEFYHKIFHHQLKDKSIWSYAAGHIDKEVSVQEFIENHIIQKAEEILRGWGFQGDELSIF